MCFNFFSEQHSPAITVVDCTIVDYESFSDVHQITYFYK